MVLPSGPSKITGLPLDESLFESKYSISDPELKVSFTTWHSVVLKFLVHVISALLGFVAIVIET